MKHLLCSIGLHDYEREDVHVGDLHAFSVMLSCPRCKRCGKYSGGDPGPEVARQKVFVDAENSRNELAMIMQNLQATCDLQRASQ